MPIICDRCKSESDGLAGGRVGMDGLRTCESCLMLEFSNEKVQKTSDNYNHQGKRVFNLVWKKNES